MLKVIASKDSRIPVGAELSAVNYHKIEDFLEFKFYNDLSKIRKVLIDKNGIKKSVIFKPQEPIPIKIAEPKYRHCENDCDFCFIRGLSKGLRKELYFRDDDYRLSFFFGNFLSLTNIYDNDIKRIDRLRLSPLYVSVHTTELKLRKRIFKNGRAELIMEQLSSLVDKNIKIHCQIVVIPGINDGENLVKTMNDLSRLYPGVESIGVVPVGRTKYSKDILIVSKTLARKVVKLCEKMHREFRKKYKKGLVYLADEFYIKSDLPIPETLYYDEFPQYENGIGMVRQFIEEIKKLRKIKKTKGKFLILTGKLAFPYLNMFKERFLYLTGNKTSQLEIMTIENSLFGDSVTVSGLISAKDVYKKISQLGEKHNRIILPPNCVNDRGMFIDELNNSQQSGDRIVIAPQKLKDLIKWLQ